MGKLERNTIDNLAGTVWSIALALLSVPFLIRFLGAEAFGLTGLKSRPAACEQGRSRKARAKTSARAILILCPDSFQFAARRRSRSETFSSARPS